jgi:hypothetical protein
LDKNKHHDSAVAEDSFTSRDGDWLVFPMGGGAPKGMTCAGFEELFELIPGETNLYENKSTVLAIGPMLHNFTAVTTLKGATEQGAPGEYLVQLPSGLQYACSSSNFITQFSPSRHLDASVKGLPHQLKHLSNSMSSLQQSATNGTNLSLTSPCPMSHNFFRGNTFSDLDALAMDNFSLEEEQQHDAEVISSCY